jgi:hypothetical protein
VLVEILIPDLSLRFAATVIGAAISLPERRR